MLTKAVTSAQTIIMEYGTDKHLSWTLISGIKVVIENEWDWLVFCDIFVNREYPLYLQKVNKDYTVKILDLGANVGYFSLYAVNECRKMEQPCEVYAFEGMPDTYDILDDRIKQCPEIKSYYGLVGSICGEAYITKSANHGTSQLDILVPSLGKNYPSVNVPYFDLENVIPKDKIDIIKCDIEGSEFDFVENYPDLLKRTDIVYMEIHNLCGSPENLRNKMKEYGFTRNVKLMERETASVEVFIRAT